MSPTETTTARHVSYRCNRGREGTIAVDVPDLGDVAAPAASAGGCQPSQGPLPDQVSLELGQGAAFVLTSRPVGGPSKSATSISRRLSSALVCSSPDPATSG